MPTLRQSWMVLVVLTVLVSAAALAGCGAAEEQAAEAPLPEACALFTRQDAETAAGLTVSGTLSSTLADVQGPSPLQCTYTTGSLLEPGVLSIELRPARNAKRAARLHESNRDTLEHLTRGKLEEVPGIGESAFWAGGDLRQLHVLYGTYQLIVTVQPGQHQLAAAKQIATTVIGRMRQQAGTQTS